MNADEITIKRPIEFLEINDSEKNMLQVSQKKPWKISQITEGKIVTVQRN